MSEVYFNETQKRDLTAFFKRLERKYDLDFSYNEKAFASGTIAGPMFSKDYSSTSSSDHGGSQGYVDIAICADPTSIKKNCYYCSVNATVEYETESYFDSYQKEVYSEEKDDVTLDKIEDIIELAFDCVESELVY